MRSTAREGQFVVLTAVVMTVVMLVMASQVFHTASLNQSFRYSSFKEVLDAINSGFAGAIKHSLSNSTHDRAKVTSDSQIFTIFHGKSLTTQLSESSYGDKNVIGNNTLKRLDLWSKVSTSSFGGYGSSIISNLSSTKMTYNWNIVKSNSTISSQILANLSRIGFTGFRNSPSTVLSADINSANLDAQGGSISTVDVKVLREGQFPVSDLSLGSFGVYNLNSTNYWKTWSVSSVTYKGGGVYTLNLASPATQSKYFLVIVLDSRGIITLTSYHP